MPDISSSSPPASRATVRRRWIPLWLWVIPLLALAAFVVYWWARPSPELIISRETTYITAPLVHGRPDYVAWQNQHLSEGVTPEDNAAVLMFQVISPEVVDSRVRSRFYQALNITEPSPQQQLILLPAYLTAQKVDAARSKVLVDAQRSFNGPVSAAEYPELAAWIESNASPLALLEAASLRERFFAPVLDAGTQPSLLTASPINLFEMRNSLSVLWTRALLRLGAGDIEGACGDALTLHRLGRLISQSGSLLARLIGFGQTRISEVILLSGKLDYGQIRQFREQLRELPPFQPSDSTVLDDRLLMLDSWLAAYYDDALGMKHVRPRDPNLMLREINEFYDDYEKHLKIPQQSERYSALRKFIAESRRKYLRLGLSAGGWLRAVRGILSGRALQEVVWELKLGGHESDAQQHTHVDVLYALQDIGASVVEYHARTGALPAALTDMVPRELDVVPLDPCDGRPLRYLVQDGKFLIYSVGVNQRDETAFHPVQERDDIHFAGDDFQFGDLDRAAIVKQAPPEAAETATRP